MAVSTRSGRPKYVCNRCVIEVLVAFLCCHVFSFFYAGMEAFAIGLSQVSYFFSWEQMSSNSRWPTHRHFYKDKDKFTILKPDDSDILGHLIVLGIELHDGISYPFPNKTEL